MLVGKCQVEGRAGCGLLALGLLLLSGCHEHVVLSVPPRDASFETRARSYEEMRPVSMHETHITYMQGAAVVGASRRTDYLQLADGKRVHYPEDLLPTLPQASPSAEAARRSESARSTSNVLFGTSMALYVGGAAVAIVPLIARDPHDTEINTTPIYVGLGAIMVGAVTYLVSRAFSSTANDEAATSFELYDGGLRKQLDLCIVDNRLVDCRAVNPAPIFAPASAPPETAPTPAAPPAEAGP